MFAPFVRDIISNATARPAPGRSNGRRQGSESEARPLPTHEVESEARMHAL
jgi:hypothetical protein